MTDLTDVTDVTELAEEEEEESALPGGGEEAAPGAPRATAADDAHVTCTVAQVTAMRDELIKHPLCDVLAALFATTSNEVSRATFVRTLESKVRYSFLFFASILLLACIACCSSILLFALFFCRDVA
jgi:hypothetical protein